MPEANRAATHVGDLPADIVAEFALLVIGDGDISPLAGQRQGDGLANSARTAGDQGFFPLQVQTGRGESFLRFLFQVKWHCISQIVVAEFVRILLLRRNSHEFRYGCPRDSDLPFDSMTSNR